MFRLDIDFNILIPITSILFHINGEKIKMLIRYSIPIHFRSLNNSTKTDKGAKIFITNVFTFKKESFIMTRILRTSIIYLQNKRTFPLNAKIPEASRHKYMIKTQNWNIYLVDVKGPLKILNREKAFHRIMTVYLQSEYSSSTVKFCLCSHAKNRAEYNSFVICFLLSANIFLSWKEME